MQIFSDRSPWDYPTVKGPKSKDDTVRRKFPPQDRSPTATLKTLVNEEEERERITPYPTRQPEANGQPPSEMVLKRSPENTVARTNEVMA